MTKPPPPPWSSSAIHKNSSGSQNWTMIMGLMGMMMMAGGWAVVRSVDAFGPAGCCDDNSGGGSGSEM